MKRSLFFFLLAGLVCAQTPASVTLGPGQYQQFSVATDKLVSWGIDTLWCGGDGVNAGTITSGGLYLAPAVIDKPAIVHTSYIVTGNFHCGPVITLTPPAPVQPPTQGGQTPGRFTVQIPVLAAPDVFVVADGSQPQTFTARLVPAGTVYVFRNGLLQAQNTDFVIGGAASYSVSFPLGLDAGDTITLVYQVLQPQSVVLDAP